MNNTIKSVTTIDTSDNPEKSPELAELEKVIREQAQKHDIHILALSLKKNKDNNQIAETNTLIIADRDSLISFGHLILTDELIKAGVFLSILGMEAENNENDNPEKSVH